MLRLPLILPPLAPAATRVERNVAPLSVAGRDGMAGGARRSRRWFQRHSVH
jgi:hypothetical protein